MMMGRDESMPNVVREADLTSAARDRVREASETILRRFATIVDRRQDLDADAVGAMFASAPLVPGDVLRMARAILRYVPAGVPESAPHPVAAADDKTRPAVPFQAGVICEPIEEESSGVCEATGDDDATKQAQLDHTAMHRSQDGQAFIVKRGPAERIAIPHIPDKTRR